MSYDELTARATSKGILIKCTLLTHTFIFKTKIDKDKGKDEADDMVSCDRSIVKFPEIRLTD